MITDIEPNLFIHEARIKQNSLGRGLWYIKEKNFLPTDVQLSITREPEETEQNLWSEKWTWQNFASFGAIVVFILSQRSRKRPS